MKRSFALLIAAELLAAPFAMTGGGDPRLRPYIEFLRQHEMPAKDYILHLFDHHDLVILCERSHADTTQYGLIMDVIADERFISAVGNVFTEIGVSSLYPAVNEFLHAEGLPADSVDRTILRFHRNASFYPLWEHQNFSQFLRKLYALNQRLPGTRKITLYPSDVPFDWAVMDEAALRGFWDTIMSRDSIMALQIIRRFDVLQRSSGARTKALVIMNYRHAFSHKFERSAGTKPDNVGRFLFDRYGKRVANVYLNWVAIAAARSDNDISLRPVQDGKWDAAFQALGRENVGFDFAGSPFGDDRFDIYPAPGLTFTFKDVFDGFAYYVPIEKQRQVMGVPGIIDSSFAREFLRRDSLFNKVRRPGTLPAPLEQSRHYYNTRREIPLDSLDAIKRQIDRWLH